MLISIYSTHVNANELRVIVSPDITSRAMMDELHSLQKLTELDVQTQISDTKKRYAYKLTLTNFTPQQVDIFSGMALASADNVQSSLLDAKT